MKRSLDGSKYVNRLSKEFSCSVFSSTLKGKAIKSAPSPVITFMNMAVRYIPILSLLIFCGPVRALYVSDVHSVHSCSNDKNVSVELLAAETSVFRIRICACFGLDGTNYVIAKSNDLCGFPISLLELDLNSSYGDSHQNCVLSKPIDFDPIFNSDEPLVLCSLNARKSWRTPIALALHPR